MDEKIMMAEMMKNFSEKKNALKELVKVYAVAKLGDEVQEAHIKEIHNRVLAENEFFAERKCSRGKVAIKKGDRIIDEEFAFLLSEDDFDKFQNLAAPILVAEKVTDEDGCYITNFSMMKVEAVNKIYEFVCKEVLPEKEGAEMWEYRWHYMTQQKVLKLTCKLFGIAA